MKVIFLYGPTASGKSAFAIRLAKELGGEIVNCDSVSVYEDLDIGSAKPSLEELAEVPHHLVSHIKYPEYYTAAKFREDALKSLTDMEKRAVPYAIIAGGTGFYFRALELGLVEIEELPVEEKEVIRKQVEENPQESFLELKGFDPEYAQKISENDHYRLARALELKSLGKKPSLAFAKRESNFPYPLAKVFLNPDRDLLRERLKLRTQKMLSQGLIAETKKLLDQGKGDWRALESVGYKESVEYIQGEISEGELFEKIVTKSMQLAKRQRTWFKKEGGFEIPSLPSDVPSFFEKLIFEK
ncbi:MAG: tRNA (adenosine(37)-N6)-dimethylallyltransferase MiaA [Bdellovibrionota bacterium]|nr:tRNA (adenosine(37)-N6)-dimethylallyltransferase MiaA [Bdellovibrionota bacterium]